MPTIETQDGAEIHYELHGTGSTNLMLLHGWGGSGETWKELVQHLDAARFRIICPDLRGHGQSGRDDGGYTWDDFDRDILAVADHEEASKFIPVGFSTGGKLACYLAAKYPDRVRAQVLIAPVGPGIVPITREVGLEVCRLAGDKQRNKDFFRSWFEALATDEMVNAYCAAIAQTPRSVLEATAEMGLWTSLVSSIGHLDLPTLLVIGESDPFYHASYQKEQLLPFLCSVNSTTLTSGHFIPLERPFELAGLILEFISGLGFEHCSRV